MIKINRQDSVIKAFHVGFTIMLDYCVSAMTHLLFLLSENGFIVSEFDRSYAYAEETDNNNKIYKGNNSKATIALTWVISIGQDPASEIHLIGIHLNHAASDNCDDFIVGFEDDLCW